MPATNSSTPVQPRPDLEPGAEPAPTSRPLRRQHIRPLTGSRASAASCRHWIDLRTSMTREIELALGARPEVQLLHEGPDGVSSWEADALDLPRQGRAYAREIALLVQGRPVMLARSLSPMDDPVSGVLRRLNRAPLAEVLFLDPRWRRSAPPLPLRWRSDRGAVPGRACLWRRSRPDGKVLVEEFFLAPLAAASPDRRVSS